MYEIWWRDRLLDVVPSAGQLPEGLTVRSRRVGEKQPIPREPRDWAFFKVLALALLFFCAAVATLELTPLVPDDTIAPSASITRLIVPVIPPPPKPSLAPHLKDKLAAQQRLANAPVPSRKDRVASIFSIFDEPSGLAGLGNAQNIDDALSHLSNTSGPSMASLGFGAPRGSGPSGTGSGPDGFHLGGLGSGPRGPSVSPGLGPKRSAGPDGPPTLHVTDGLPREVVAKVIRRHAAEIKYCYERQLQQDQTLAGKVTVAFTIGLSGDVIDAQLAETTLDNATVEDCVLARIRRWKFPEPNGGGTVAVNHPWIFRGAGDNESENP